MKPKRRFLPELIGLALALGAISGNSRAPGQTRPAKDMPAIEAKRAAKLARRAKRAGF
jgi:hypothetical protein